VALNVVLKASSVAPLFCRHRILFIRLFADLAIEFYSSDCSLTFAIEFYSSDCSLTSPLEFYSSDCSLTSPLEFARPVFLLASSSDLFLRFLLDSPPQFVRLAGYGIQIC